MNNKYKNITLRNKLNTNNEIMKIINNKHST